MIRKTGTAEQSAVLSEDPARQAKLDDGVTSKQKQVSL